MQTHNEPEEPTSDRLGVHLSIENDLVRCEAGIVRFDLLTLRARVEDRSHDPFPRFRQRLRAVAEDEGEDALRALALRLVRGMILSELRDELPYAAVESLVEAAEGSLEPRRSPCCFESALSLYRREIEAAGLFDWMACAPRCYGAPPLLAAASLLDDDPWTALRTAYDMAEWLDDIFSDGDREYLYAPDRASRIVEAFLSEYDYGY